MEILKNCLQLIIFYRVVWLTTQSIISDFMSYHPGDFGIYLTLPTTEYGLT